jgi:hypothetical protein
MHADGWPRNGLQGTKRHSGNGQNIHHFSEKNILCFIRVHPDEIDIGDVDQTWFLDLVLLRGRPLGA